MDYTTDYFFDLVGNRVGKTTDQGNNGTIDEAVTSLYDANDRLLSEAQDDLTPANNDRFTVYGYGPSNSATQQTSKTVHAGADAMGAVLETTTYGYDLRGRMSSATHLLAGGVTDSTSVYGYNDSGIRTSQAMTTGGVTKTTLFVIDDQNPTGYAQVLEEKSSTGTIPTASTAPTRTYTLGHDVLAQADGAAGPVRVLLKDGHGSTRQVVDAMGVVLPGQVFSYDAYGNAHGFQPAAAQTTIQYSGQWFEVTTGLQYLRARWYDAASGRFTSLDPFAGNKYDPQSLHKYLYVHANPVMGVDPTGMFEGLVGVAAGNSIGAMINNMTAQVGQAVAASLGFDMPVGPIDVLLDREIGILPESVYDAIDAARGFILEHSGEILQGATFSTVAIVLGGRGRQLTLFDKFAKAFSDVADLLSPSVTRHLVHPTLEARGTLRSAARRVHSLVTGQALEKSTIALAEVKLPNGYRVVFGAASSRGLEDEQAQALKELGVLIVKGTQHAERNIADHLPAGSVVERWGISRSTNQTNIMCDNCLALLQTLGGIIE